MSMAPANSGLRPDFAIIAEWIRPGSRVLDLGCGDGTLMKHLAQHKNVGGYGLELDDIYIPACLRNGINVIQTDLDRGLAEFDDDSFDCVVLSLTLQAMHYPAQLLREMLRVGTIGIVTFPNFGHWHVRYHIGLRGRMPINTALPNQWYDTPNIHLCTLQDFETPTRPASGCGCCRTCWVRSPSTVSPAGSRRTSRARPPAAGASGTTPARSPVCPPPLRR